MTCERCGHAVIEHRVIDPYHTVDECITNLRADLAEARQEIETIDAFRAAPWSEIRKLLGDDDSPDEAIAGTVCATILTHRALAANKREAEEYAYRLEREHENRNVVEAERLATILRLETDLEAERAHVRELEDKLDFETSDYQRMNTLRQEAMRKSLDTETRACAAEERAARAEAALAKINMIRNGIVGSQTINWSEHIYPLVAALDAVGVQGMEYPEAREFIGTMLDRANAAEAQCAAMQEAAAQAAETQPFYPDTHTGMRQQWVKLQIAARIRALDPPDAGRDLLTAVRRLCEAAHMVLHEDIHEERSYGALDVALADPALAGLRGAP